MVDVDRVRADTPGCESVLHFNNAGSSLPPTPVVEATVAYLRKEAAMGGYEAQDASEEDFVRFSTAAATMLHCATDEVAFVTSASEGWWRAFLSVPLGSGDRVLLGRSEFASNALGLLQAADRGVELVVIDHDADGLIDLDQLEAELSRGAALVCLTQISMSNGAVQPAAAVGALARAAGAIYLLDACQAAGQMPLDVGDLGCDFLVFTGRKFMRGPRGTGVLFARRDVMDRLADPVFIDLRSGDWTSPTTYTIQPTAQRFEFGETSYASKVGLGVAMDYALSIGLGAIHDRVRLLAADLRASLGEIDGLTVHDQGLEKSGIVTFTVDGVPAPDIGRRLRARSINTSTPGARNARLDLGTRGIDSVVRAGIHYFNTHDEIDRFVAAVAEVS